VRLPLLHTGAGDYYRYDRFVDHSEFSRSAYVSTYPAIVRARQLLNMPAAEKEILDANGVNDSDTQALSKSCPCCGGRMVIIETFERGDAPRYRPAAPVRIDTFMTAVICPRTLLTIRCLRRLSRRHGYARPSIIATQQISRSITLRAPQRSFRRHPPPHYRLAERTQFPSNPARAALKSPLTRGTALRRLFLPAVPSFGGSAARAHRTILRAADV
jgi:hypothetical protein